jgi:hypothetical protein
MSYEAKDTILGMVRTEGDQFFGLVDDDAVWQAPTGAGHRQVRDLVAHIVETTEAYFVAFDAGRSGGEMDTAYGLRGMAGRVERKRQAADRFAALLRG